MSNLLSSVTGLFSRKSAAPASDGESKEKKEPSAHELQAQLEEAQSKISDLEKPGNEKAAKEALKNRANSVAKWLAIVGGILLVLVVLFRVLDPFGFGFVPQTAGVQAKQAGLQDILVVVFLMELGLIGSSLLSSRQRKQFVLDGIVPILSGVLVIFGADWRIFYAIFPSTPDMVAALTYVVPTALIVGSLVAVVIATGAQGWDWTPFGMFFMVVAGCIMLKGDAGAFGILFGVPPSSGVYNVFKLVDLYKQGQSSEAELTLWTYVALGLSLFAYQVEGWKPRKEGGRKKDPVWLLVFVLCFAAYLFLRFYGISAPLGPIVSILLTISAAAALAGFAVPAIAYFVDPEQFSKSGLSVYLKLAGDVFDAVISLLLAFFVVGGWV